MTLRLRSVALEDVRRFSGPWRVGPFGPGLNLLAAPNEAGKSTLLEAIRCAILLPHRSQGEEVRRLRPLAGGVPTVTLTLDDGAGLWTIRKRFAGAAGRAELVAPDGRTWLGEPAEEEIRRLFGLPPPAPGRGMPARGVWGALWVEQGGSLRQPELDRAAQDLLRGALEAEIDTVTGVRGAARLRAAIATELLAFQTAKGQRAAGRLREVEDRLAEILADERELRARREHAEAALARLAALRAERAERLSARLGHAAEEAVTEARRRVEALREAAARRDALARAAADAARLREAAAEAWRRREDDARQAEDARREAERLADLARDAESEAKAARDRWIALEAAAAEAEAKAARRHAEALAEAVRRLREAEESARAAVSRRPSAGWSAAAALTALAAVGLGGLTATAVVPGEVGWTGAAAALLAALALALAILLRSRAAGRAEEEAQARLAAARDAVSLVAPQGLPEAALAAAEAKAEETANRAQAALREATARGLAVPEEVSDVARNRAQAEAAEAEKAALLARAEADQAAKTARERATALAGSRQREPDEALRERLRQAEDAMREAALARDSLPVATEAEIAEAQRTLQRAEAERERIAKEELRLEGELREAEATLRTLEADGIDDRLAALAEERGRLERERDALERARDGLRLLDRVLAEEEAAAKAEWVSPVARAVGPWLARVLGAELVEIDQGLGVTTIRRGGRVERIEILSAGTQEQIAILVRLAFAVLLERQGKPAPVILDDALVFSDDVRMDRMFEVLGEAAGSVQIIVLTCRGDLFARLAAHPVALERAA
ncbi:MAG: AAA family ATPase [Acetobacteraceae bacterium]|nr:AAA family ATPase [Acetobacteraceae bacterium]